MNFADEQSWNENNRSGRRGFYIKKKGVEVHGHIKDCSGYRAMFHGGTRQAHTVERRERFRDLMKDEDEVVRTGKKRKEFVEKMEEETRRLELKKQKQDGEGGRHNGQRGSQQGGEG